MISMNDIMENVRICPECKSSLILHISYICCPMSSHHFSAYNSCLATRGVYDIIIMPCRITQRGDRWMNVKTKKYLNYIDVWQLLSMRR